MKTSPKEVSRDFTSDRSPRPGNALPDTSDRRSADEHGVAVTGKISNQRVRLTISPAEAAEILGISRHSVYRLIVRGLLIPIPGLRNKRLPTHQVMAMALGKPVAIRDLADARAFPSQTWNGSILERH